MKLYKDTVLPTFGFNKMLYNYTDLLFIEANLSSHHIDLDMISYHHDTTKCTSDGLSKYWTTFESNQESNQAATIDLINGLSSEIIGRIESSTNEQSQAILSEIKLFEIERSEKADKLQEQMLEQFKTIKVLNGVIMGLLVLSIVLNLVY